MAHVSEDYGAAPPGAAAVRTPEGPSAAPRPQRLPAFVAKGRATTTYASAVRRKIGALCPPLKALPV